MIADTCPTFSWGVARGASSYELLVYRLGEENEEERPVLTQTFAGSAFSWTPSLDRCLELGGQYAWSVRALSDEEESEWSAPSLFEVAGGPTEMELEKALQVLRHYRAGRGGSDCVADSEQRPSVVALDQSLPLSTRDTSADAATSAPLSMSVDGGSAAAWFAGDGSRLTNLTVRVPVCDLWQEAGEADLPPFCRKRVFVTSLAFSADLITEALTRGLGSFSRGLDAGDALCQWRATEAGLSGTFKAWLSDSLIDARDRLTAPGGPWYWVDGTTLVANNIEGFLADPAANACTGGEGGSDCLLNPIAATEQGTEPPTNFVWTGTSDDGRAPNDSVHCQGWSTISSPEIGITGQRDQQDKRWTDSQVDDCAGANHLYCFQERLDGPD
jgi:hypothetical protein